MSARNPNYRQYSAFLASVARALPDPEKAERVAQFWVSQPDLLEERLLRTLCRIGSMITKLDEVQIEETPYFSAQEFLTNTEVGGSVIYSGFSERTTDVFTRYGNFPREAHKLSFCRPERINGFGPILEEFAGFDAVAVELSDPWWLLQHRDARCVLSRTHSCLSLTENSSNYFFFKFDGKKLVLSLKFTEGNPPGPGSYGWDIEVFPVEGSHRLYPEDRIYLPENAHHKLYVLCADGRR